MMTRTMRNLILRLLLVQLIFVVTVLASGYWYWLLNFELAFFASMSIIVGSFSGYKRLVQRRIDAGEGEESVFLEKIEDPYELYDEQTEEETPVEELDLRQVVKEEKQRLKANRQTFKKTIKSAPGLFSPWRFLPYIFLVLSFIALNNNHILDLSGFLIGLGFGIATAVLIGTKWIKNRQ